MSADRLEQIGREITARVEKLDKLGAKAADHVDSIDRLLAEAEKLCETAEAFATFKQTHCAELGRSRIYELLAIKDGRKTREEIRALTRARVARHRAGKKAVTDKPSVTSKAAAGECSKAPAPERSAEPQASDAANKRILKSKVTKVELLTMLEPIQALAFEDDEGRDFVATISDGDAVVYDALEVVGGIIDELRAALLETNDSTEADQDDGATIDSKGIFLALAANAADKVRIALRNIAGEKFTLADKEKMVAAIDHLISVWERAKRKIQVKEDAANHAEAETAPLTHEDLSIPEFLRREKPVGKAAA
jgi:hypothetical protein